MGFQVVAGVAPALHSPLMSVTNAISGMTAVGGLELMTGGVLPDTWMAVVAALAVLLSSVNIAGGFVMTGRMLEMFRRKTDPDEKNNLYAIPLVGALGFYGYSVYTGVKNPEKPFPRRSPAREWLSAFVLTPRKMLLESALNIVRKLVD